MSFFDAITFVFFSFLFIKAMTNIAEEVGKYELKLAAENLVKTTFCQSKIGKYLSIGHFFTKILFSNEKMRFGSYIDDKILK